MVALLGLLFFQQLLARGHDVAALLVQLDDADIDLVTLQAIEIAHRAQINLRTGQKGARAQNVDGQAALDAIDDARLDRSLIVEGLLDLVPGAQALRLLVREVDVALFGVAGLAHHGDLVAALNGHVAFVVLEFRDRNHALGLVADVDHHILRRDFQHGAGDDLLFVQRGFGLGLLLLKGLQSGGEIFHGGFFFDAGADAGAVSTEVGVESEAGSDAAQPAAGSRAQRLAVQAGRSIAQRLAFRAARQRRIPGSGWSGRCGFLRKTCGCVRTLARFENAQRAWR